jgi:hypothetical protein
MTEDYLLADDWMALKRLEGAARRGLIGAALPASQAAKLSRRGYLGPSTRGVTTVTAAGRTALANWERSRRG